MPTMSHMRHLLFTAVLLSACSEPVEPTPTCRWRDLDVAACEARCKTGDRESEVCGVGNEVACRNECLACEPADAWCPRD